MMTNSLLEKIKILIEEGRSLGETAASKICDVNRHKEIYYQLSFLIKIVYGF